MSDTTVLRNQMNRRRTGPRDVRPAARTRSGRPTSGPGLSSEHAAIADRIFEMPTVEQVVAAGYPREHWNKVKKRRNDLLQRFRTDAAFRDEVIADYQRRRVPG